MTLGKYIVEVDAGGVTVLSITGITKLYFIPKAHVVLYIAALETMSRLIPLEVPLIWIADSNSPVDLKHTIDPALQMYGCTHVPLGSAREILAEIQRKERQ